MSDKSISIKKIDDTKWRIEKCRDMKTHGIVYADEKMIDAIKHDDSLSQITNVAPIDSPCLMVDDEDKFFLFFKAHFIAAISSSEHPESVAYCLFFNFTILAIRHS